MVKEKGTPSPGNARRSTRTSTVSDSLSSSVKKLRRVQSSAIHRVGSKSVKSLGFFKQHRRNLSCSDIKRKTPRKGPKSGTLLAERPKRQIVHKDKSAGLSWREETELQKALYASLHAKSKTLEQLPVGTKLRKPSSDLKLDVSQPLIHVTDHSNENSDCNTPTPSTCSNKNSVSSMKSPVRAQRKFAQGSRPSSPCVTPVKSRTPTATSSPQPLAKSLILNANKCAKTDDFLTFLCYRGTPLLPSHLDHFNQPDSELLISCPSTPKQSNGSRPDTPASFQGGDTPRSGRSVKSRQHSRATSPDREISLSNSDLGVKPLHSEQPGSVRIRSSRSASNSSNGNVSSSDSQLYETDLRKYVHQSELQRRRSKQTGQSAMPLSNFTHLENRTKVESTDIDDVTSSDLNGKFHQTSQAISVDVGSQGQGRKQRFRGTSRFWTYEHTAMSALSPRSHDHTYTRMTLFPDRPKSLPYENTRSHGSKGFADVRCYANDRCDIDSGCICCLDSKTEDVVIDLNKSSESCSNPLLHCPCSLHECTCDLNLLNNFYSSPNEMVTQHTEVGFCNNLNSVNYFNCTKEAMLTFEALPQLSNCDVAPLLTDETPLSLTVETPLPLAPLLTGKTPLPTDETPRPILIDSTLLFQTDERRPLLTCNNPLLTERNPRVLTKKTPPALTDETSSMLAEGTSSLSIDRASQYLTDEISPLLPVATSPLQMSHLPSFETSSLLADEMTTLLTVEVPHPLTDEELSLFISEMPPLLTDKTPPVSTDETPDMLTVQVQSLLNDEMSKLLTTDDLLTTQVPHVLNDTFTNTTASLLNDEMSKRCTDETGTALFIDEVLPPNPGKTHNYVDALCEFRSISDTMVLPESSVLPKGVIDGTDMIVSHEEVVQTITKKSTTSSETGNRHNTLPLAKSRKTDVSLLIDGITCVSPGLADNPRISLSDHRYSGNTTSSTKVAIRKTTDCSFSSSDVKRFSSSEAGLKPNPPTISSSDGRVTSLSSRTDRRTSLLSSLDYKNNTSYENGKSTAGVGDSRKTQIASILREDCTKSRNCTKRLNTLKRMSALLAGTGKHKSRDSSYPARSRKRANQRAVTFKVAPTKNSRYMPRVAHAMCKVPVCELTRKSLLSIGKLSTNSPGFNERKFPRFDQHKNMPADVNDENCPLPYQNSDLSSQSADGCVLKNANDCCGSDPQFCSQSGRGRKPGSVLYPIPVPLMSPGVFMSKIKHY